VLEFDRHSANWWRVRERAGERMGLSDFAECYNLARRDTWASVALPVVEERLLTLDCFEHVRVRTNVPPDQVDRENASRDTPGVPG
jgi:hypothetical protein